MQRSVLFAHTLGLFGLMGLFASCAPMSHSPAQAVPDTRLSLPATDTLSMVILGDQGTGTAQQMQVAWAVQQVCAAQGCDLATGLGDNFYERGPTTPSSALFQERFATPYGALNIPFLMIPGNHDESWLFGGDGADAAGAEAQIAYGKQNPQWVMPARFYRVQTGATQSGTLAQFFAVDTSPLAAYLPPRRTNEAPGGSWATAQAAWLGQTLSRSTAHWNIVLGHHPLLSNGKHGDAGRFDHLPFAFQNGSAVRDLYTQTCGKADLILSGHDHALELFAPQPECPGTWTAVSGAAGKTEGGKVGQRPAAYEAYGQLGFMWLKLEAHRLTLQVFTVAASGPQNAQPQLAYTTTITK